MRDVMFTGGKRPSLSTLALNFLSHFKNQPYLVGGLFPLSTETKILELPNPPHNKKFRDKETYQEENTQRKCTKISREPTRKHT